MSRCQNAGKNPTQNSEGRPGCRPGCGHISFFAIHLHLLWTCLIRVREHPEISRNDPKQTTIQVTLGSCNDCKMFQSFKVVTILKPWAYFDQLPAHPSGKVNSVWGGSFQEEPFFWIAHKQLGVSKNSGTPKWMIGGYHYFRKHPYLLLLGVLMYASPIVFCIYILCSPFSGTSINFPHQVSSHAIECPSLVLPYHFLIWILQFLSFQSSISDNSRINLEIPDKMGPQA